MDSIYQKTLVNPEDIDERHFLRERVTITPSRFTPFGGRGTATKWKKQNFNSQRILNYELDETVKEPVASPPGKENIQQTSMLKFPKSFTPTLTKPPIIFSTPMSQAMEMYNWRLLDGTIPRHGRTFELDQPTVPAKFRDLVLIAERLRREIRLASPYWQLLDPPNQTGVVIHEITYALMPALVVLGGRARAINSPRMKITADARYVVGVFFHPEGYSKSRMDMLDIFPVRPEPSLNLNYSSIHNMIYFSGGGVAPREMVNCDIRMEALFGCPESVPGPGESPRPAPVNMNPTGVYEMSFKSFGPANARSWYLKVELDAP